MVFYLCLLFAVGSCPSADELKVSRFHRSVTAPRRVVWSICTTALAVGDSSYGLNYGASISPACGLGCPDGTFFRSVLETCEPIQLSGQPCFAVCAVCTSNFVDAVLGRAARREFVLVLMAVESHYLRMSLNPAISIAWVHSVGISMRYFSASNSRSNAAGFTIYGTRTHL